MTTKEVKLRRRLNDLENDLKELHAKVLNKRISFSLNDASNKSVIKPNAIKDKLKKKKGHNENKNAVQLGEECWNCVQNIRQGIIRGACNKELDKKLASLTEVTSISTKLTPLYYSSPFGYTDETTSMCGVNAEYRGCPGAKTIKYSHCSRKEKPDVKNITSDMTIGFKDKTQCKKKSTMSETTVMVPSRSQSPVVLQVKEDSFSSVDFKCIKSEMEAKLKEFKFFEEKIEVFKKKLYEERAKRTQAETAMHGYRRRLAVAESVQPSSPIPKKVGRNKIKTHMKKELGTPEISADLEESTPSVARLVRQLRQKLIEENMLDDKKISEVLRQTQFQPATAHTLAVLEQELKEEKDKRTEAEKVLEGLKKEVEESKREVERLDEGRKLAVAMADKFRDRSGGDSKEATKAEVEKLRQEKSRLEEELVRVQEGTVGAGTALVDRLVERAEKAERELLDKMKQCNAFMARSSVNDPDVVQVIEKHKRAYNELQLEKKCMEAELRAKCSGLERELEESVQAADHRILEANERYNEALVNLRKKESALDKLIIEKIQISDELANLKLKVNELMKQKQHHESCIKSLNATIDSNRKIVEQMKKTEDLNRVDYTSVEQKLIKMKEVMSNQESVIVKLRSEIQEERDKLKVKEKMLQDQTDTIRCLKTVSDNSRKALEEERAAKEKIRQDSSQLKHSNETLKEKLAKLEIRLREEEEHRLSQKKNSTVLEQLEQQVYLRKQEWDRQLSLMCHEKDQAIQTARFATEKLVQAVHDYEEKLTGQKKLQRLLNAALKDKEYQLEVANRQVSQLNEEVWKSARTSEQVRNELQAKLRRACEVCTDVLDNQVAQTV